MSRPRNTRPSYRLNYRERPGRQGAWYLDYTDPATGKTRSVGTGITDPAATEEAELFRDQFVTRASLPPLPPVLLIKEILEHYRQDRSGKVQAPATLTFSISALSRHIGNLEPHMLSRRGYIEAREQEGVKDGTIRREIGVLRAALRLAVKDKWLASEPLLDAPSVPPPRERFLSHDEIGRLIQAAYLLHLKVFVVLAYHTGARKGAILDLTWDRVKFDERLIEYERAGRQQSNKRRASVPMNSVVVSLLQTAYELRTTDYVVEWRGKPVRAIRTAFDDACARAGIAGCSPHILRHTSATHMVMAGVPLREIARYLGTTEAVVELIYGKHAPDYLRNAAESLAGPAKLRKIENVAGENVAGAIDVAAATETLVSSDTTPQKSSRLRKMARKITA